MESRHSNFVATAEMGSSPTGAKGVAVVISTSSTEIGFLEPQLRESRKFAQHVVVAVADKRFNGEPETVDWRSVASKFPWASFVMYEIKTQAEIYNPLQIRPGAYWHNMARIAGMDRLHGIVEGVGADGGAMVPTWVLFLDGDEIPDGDAMAADWEQSLRVAGGGEDAIQRTHKLANYWYFRSPTYQATTWEDSAVLVPFGVLARQTMAQLLMTDYERDYMYAINPGRRNLCGMDGKPMLHHFSWVRQKKDLIAKVRSWGHAGDKDWVALVDEEWSKAFSGTDFIHQYSYMDVEDRFGLVAWIDGRDDIPPRNSI